MDSVGSLIQPVSDCRDRALNALGQLPPFSPVLNRLLGTLSDDGVVMAKIADIIEKDTVIAGNVMRLVNSALYGRRGTVNSVRHAVSLLGINKLRNAVFAMSMSRVWSSLRSGPSWSTARFNLHSVACGLMADLLAQKVRVLYPEGAFAAGLFHDLGRLLIAVGLPAEYAEIQRIYKQTDWPLDTCEEKIVGITHAELAADALAIWNLPEPIQTAVRFHHHPESAPGDATLANMIRCADEYVNLTGVSIQAEDEVRELSEQPLRSLGITLPEDALVKEFQLELEVLSGVFR